ncbi:MAG: MFS transporter [Actinobacteria bacterium]|nr:MFS transporter [Actinomycetota bacterium]
MILNSATLREFLDVLNPYSRKMILGVMLSAIGTGMTLSLLLVYLHDMRGFTNTFGGFLLSFGAAVSLTIGGPVGTLIDHIGPKKVMTIQSIGAAFIWPPMNVMLTRLSDEKDRQKIFGLNFMVLNLGIGVGGVFASLVITEGSLRSFQIMYLLDSITFLLFLSVVLLIRTPKVGKYIPDAHEEKGGSYKDVWANKQIVLLSVSGLVLLIFGYASLQAGLPIYATQYLDLSPKWLGIFYAANTVSIVLFQPAVLRRLNRESKYKALIAVGIIWSLSWAVVGISPLLPLLAGALMLCISQVVFAFGEMIWSPTMPALANDLSPEHIRGRTNALIGLQWGVSGVIGPAISGPMLEAGQESAWIFTMLCGALLPLPLFIRLKKLANK